VLAGLTSSLTASCGVPLDNGNDEDGLHEYGRPYGHGYVVCVDHACGDQEP
jgi:hypothetical protein